MNAPEIKVALNSLIPPNLFFKETKIGTEPMISITANRVKLTVSNYLKFISIAWV